MSEAFGENTLQTIDEDKELTFNENPVVEAVEQGNNLGLAARNPVFGVSDKVRFKPAYSDTETS